MSTIMIRSYHQKQNKNSILSGNNVKFPKKIRKKFSANFPRSHAYGWDAEQAVDDARTTIAKFINAKRDKEIVRRQILLLNICQIWACVESLQIVNMECCVKMKFIEVFKLMQS
jgi:hypothetical protein